MPDQAYQAGNPNWVYSHVKYTNVMRLNGFLGIGFVHEMGHHFGLLHTFFNASVAYNVPMPGDNTNDYPYKVFLQNGQLNPAWWGRELVIRDEITDGNDPRLFKSVNANETGDLIFDTPADCRTTVASQYPGCLSTAQNINTCALDATLTYKDYNGDAINPPPAGFSLGKNYMSYWYDNCRDHFTPGQHNNIAFYYETVRRANYTPDRCGTFTDKVELEGTSTPLQNVTLRVRHPNDPRICNVTSSKTGDYSGIFHTDNVKVYAFHNGKNAYKFPNDPLKIHFGHARCEWVRGVDVDDLLKIHRHILGFEMLPSGYKQIAADANKDNHITTFDIIEFRKLILGTIQELPYHDQPWRYIPEFIPQNNSAQFNINPFNVFNGGGAAYLEQGWQYTIPSNGQRGFDGIKIGDVDGSWLADGSCPELSGEPPVGGTDGNTPSFNVPTTGLLQGQIIKLVVKAQNFIQVKGFQLGINLPYSHFELLDVSDMSLPYYTKSDQFGLMQLEENAVKTLWFNEAGTSTTLTNNSTLFSLIVKAKQPIENLQKLITLDNNVLRNIFIQTGVSPTTLSVSVESALAYHSAEEFFSNTETDNILTCEPNPFNNILNIGFNHQGSETSAELRISNVSGGTVFQKSLAVQKNMNHLSINDFQDFPSGIYWLTLLLEGKSYAKKIVKN